jgi:hypothetical protein
MRFSNAGQFVPVKFAEPRQPSVFCPPKFLTAPLALWPDGRKFFQADETQAGSQSVPCECPIASPAHFFFPGLKYALPTSKTPCANRSKPRLLVQTNESDNRQSSRSLTLLGMATPPKQRLTKRRIALVQLEQSLNLLEAGDPISALTLAGAAEEILGKAAIRKGHEPRVEYNADWVGSFFDYMKKPRPSKRQLVSALNTVRNHLKHQDNGCNIKVEADFEFEAQEMILRCMFNHFNAYGCYPSNKRLRAWFENMTL